MPHGTQQGVGVLVGRLGGRRPEGGARAVEHLVLDAVHQFAGDSTPALTEAAGTSTIETIAGGQFW